MILVAVYLGNTRQFVQTPVPEGRLLRIGRNPEEGDHEGVLVIPWMDRVVNRNHSSARRSGDNLVLELADALPDRPPPNRFFTLAANRTALPGNVTLKPVDGVIIGKHGQTALCWVENLAQLEELTGQADDWKPLPSRTMYRESELSAYELRFHLHLLQEQLPEIITARIDPYTRLERLASFVRLCISNQGKSNVAFLSFRHEYGQWDWKIVNGNAMETQDFAPSRTLLGPIAEDLPAAGVATRVWSRTQHTQDAPQTSLGDSVDWILIQPVEDPRSPGKWFRWNESLLCVYVEVREGARAGPDRISPMIKLMTALIPSMLPSEPRSESTSDGNSIDKMSCSPSLLVPPKASRQTLMLVGTSPLARDEPDLMQRAKSVVADPFRVVCNVTGDTFTVAWGSRDAPVDEERVRRAVESACLVGALVEPSDARSGGPMLGIAIHDGECTVDASGTEAHAHAWGEALDRVTAMLWWNRALEVPLLLSESAVPFARHTGRLIRRLPCRHLGGERDDPDIYEVVLSTVDAGATLSPSDVQAFERALTALEREDWSTCLDCLQPLAAAGDQPSKRLLQRADQLRSLQARNERTRDP